MSSSGFLVASVVFSMHSIMSSASSDSFIFSFPYLIHLIYFFFLLVWMLWFGLPILCWMKVLSMGSVMLEEMLLTFHYWVWCELWVVIIYVLYYVEICSLYAHFLESFLFFLIMNGCWILSKFCLHVWDDYMVLSFNLLMWWITSIDL